MTVQGVMQRLERYERRRALFWSIAVALLWFCLWVGIWYIIFQENQDLPLEAELFAEEAYFYLIGL